MTVRRGDIRDPGVLQAAMQGVHMVLHTAALVDYRGTVPFWELRAVNVGGEPGEGPALTHTLRSHRRLQHTHSVLPNATHPEMGKVLTTFPAGKFLPLLLYPCSGLSTAHQIWAQFWHSCSGPAVLFPPLALRWFRTHLEWSETVLCVTRATIKIKPCSR